MLPINLDGEVAWSEVVEKCEDMRDKYPHYRYGQALFNTLDLVAPEFAARIRGTELDTYHSEAVFLTTYAAIKKDYIEWKEVN